MLDLQVFKDKINDFLTFLEVEKNLSSHTLRAYKIDLEQIIKFWQTSISRDKNLVIYFDRVMRRYVVSLFYKKLEKTTLARKISCLRSFLLFLNSSGIKCNLNFKAPKLDKKLPTTLSVDEVFYLLDTINLEELQSKFPYRDKAIFELLYATGVRCSELVNITLSNIDFDNKFIKVMGKGRKERLVLFGNKAEKALKLYLEKERSLLLKNEQENYLFLNYMGKKLTSRTVQRIFEMFRKFLKIERRLTPHKVRHSFATHLLNQGTDLRVIQELLGHKTIATTEIYTHVTSSHLSKMFDEKHPLNKLDKLVFDDGN